MNQMHASLRYPKDFVRLDTPDRRLGARLGGGTTWTAHATVALDEAVLVGGLWLTSFQVDATFCTASPTDDARLTKVTVRSEALGATPLQLDVPHRWQALRDEGTRADPHLGWLGIALLPLALELGDVVDQALADGRTHVAARADWRGAIEGDATADALGVHAQLALQAGTLQALSWSATVTLGDVHAEVDGRLQPAQRRAEAGSVRTA